MRRYSNFFMNPFQLWENTYWSQGGSLFFKEYSTFHYGYFLVGSKGGYLCPVYVVMLAQIFLWFFKGLTFLFASNTSAVFLDDGDVCSLS